MRRRRARGRPPAHCRSSSRRAIEGDVEQRARREAVLDGVHGADQKLPLQSGAGRRRPEHFTATTPSKRPSMATAAQVGPGESTSAARPAGRGRRAAVEHRVKCQRRIVPGGVTRRDAHARRAEHRERRVELAVSARAGRRRSTDGVTSSPNSWTARAGPLSVAQRRTGAGRACRHTQPDTSPMHDGCSRTRSRSSAANEAVPQAPCAAARTVRPLSRSRPREGIVDLVNVRLTVGDHVGREAEQPASSSSVAAAAAAAPTPAVPAAAVSHPTLRSSRAARRPRPRW